MKKIKFLVCFILVLILIMLAGCNDVKYLDLNNNELKEDSELDLYEELVDSIIQNMSLSDMVYQMMFVTPEAMSQKKTVTFVDDTLKESLESYSVGGIIYFAENFIDRQQTINMISKTQSYSKIPLFIGVDEEGGRVSRLGNNYAMGITKHPPMKEIGDTKDPQKAYEVGRILGKELSELGFNVDFAPNSDVITNINNKEIGNRSFGTDPQNVSLMVENVVKGLNDNNMSCSLKHFPGHGSTYKDSHTGYSESNRTYNELQNNEFLPFKAGIKAGADFVMVSHMTLVNATDEKVCSSLSKEVITDMLINELGFKGIVITDSFSMGAITREYSVEEASVKAVKAGVDMILMPSDLQKSHSAVLSAVNSGEISKERIEQSVRKILLLKAKRGILN